MEVLYPNDNHISGKELRLKQQYFFVSASLQRALERHKKEFGSLATLPEKVVFQMNDTHPTLTVAELMRLLIDEEGIGWDDAWEITTHCVAYTNHTIMSEALEKWPIEIFSRLLPRIYNIVEEINRRFCLDIERQFPGDDGKKARMAIVYDGQVRMAHLAIAASYSVNGVARLHTEILKKKSLKDFYDMYGKTLSFARHGQALLQAGNIIDSGGELLCKRVVAEDATLSNMVLSIELTTVTKQDRDKDTDELLYVDHQSGDVTTVAEDTSSGSAVQNEPLLVTSTYIKWKSDTVANCKTSKDYQRK